MKAGVAKITTDAGGFLRDFNAADRGLFQDCDIAHYSGVDLRPENWATG
jgi:hypothetical protein